MFHRMSRQIKRVAWAIWLLVMCWLMYQLLGWLGVLLIVGAGVIGGVAVLFINRKVRKDEQIARFRDGQDSSA